MEAGFYPIDGSLEDGILIAYSLHALADLNGDGILDIIIGWRNYEGKGYAVCDPSGDRPVEALKSGCYYNLLPS